MRGDVHTEGRADEQRGHSRNEKLKKARQFHVDQRSRCPEEAREIDENLTKGFTAPTKIEELLRTTGNEIIPPELGTKVILLSTMWENSFFTIQIFSIRMIWKSRWNGIGNRENNHLFRVSSHLITKQNLF